MAVMEMLKRRRAEILAVARRHGATDIRVFGSVARGEDNPASDVDLLVKSGPVTSSWFPAGLIQDLEELLGRKVDVVTETSLHWYIRDKILTEAVPL